MNIAKLVGFIAGVAVSLLLIVVFMKRRGYTDGSNKTEYDERQLIARGRGFMLAYYTLLIYLAVIIMIDMLDVTIPCSMTVLVFTGFVISGLVLSFYTIMNDAYWGINNNVSLITRAIIAIGIINFVFGIVDMCKGKMVVEGILQDGFINFEAGVLILAIGIMLLIKKRKDKQEAGEI